MNRRPFPGYIVASVRDRDGGEAGFSQSGLASLITVPANQPGVFIKGDYCHVEVLRNNTGEIIDH